MLDIDKQVAYWRNGAAEDWQVAQDLIGRKLTRHGLFFVHLALEKLLKAHVCRRTENLAPRIHNLIRLAELAELTPSETQIDILADINAFNLEGRYPDALIPVPSPSRAQEYLHRAGEVYQWLMKQLSDQ